MTLTEQQYIEFINRYVDVHAEFYRKASFTKKGNEKKRQNWRYLEQMYLVCCCPYEKEHNLINESNFYEITNEDNKGVVQDASDIDAIIFWIKEHHTEANILKSITED
jgi:hypothetical protein